MLKKGARIRHIARYLDGGMHYWPNEEDQNNELAPKSGRFAQLRGHWADVVVGAEKNSAANAREIERSRKAFRRVLNEPAAAVDLMQAVFLGRRWTSIEFPLILIRHSASGTLGQNARTENNMEGYPCHM